MPPKAKSRGRGRQTKLTGEKLTINDPPRGAPLEVKVETLLLQKYAKSIGTNRSGAVVMSAAWAYATQMTMFHARQGDGLKTYKTDIEHAKFNGIPVEIQCQFASMTSSAVQSRGNDTTKNNNPVTPKCQVPFVFTDIQSGNQQWKTEDVVAKPADIYAHYKKFADKFGINLDGNENNTQVQSSVITGLKFIDAFCKSAIKPSYKFAEEWGGSVQMYPYFLCDQITNALACAMSVYLPFFKFVTLVHQYRKSMRMDSDKKVENEIGKIGFMTAVSLRRCNPRIQEILRVILNNPNEYGQDALRDFFQLCLTYPPKTTHPTIPHVYEWSCVIGVSQEELQKEGNPDLAANVIWRASQEDQVMCVDESQVTGGLLELFTKFGMTFELASVLKEAVGNTDVGSFAGILTQQALFYGRNNQIFRYFKPGATLVTVNHVVKGTPCPQFGVPDLNPPINSQPLMVSIRSVKGFDTHYSGQVVYVPRGKNKGIKSKADFGIRVEKLQKQGQRFYPKRSDGRADQPYTGWFAGIKQGELTIQKYQSINDNPLRNKFPVMRVFSDEEPIEAETLTYMFGILTHGDFFSEIAETKEFQRTKDGMKGTDYYHHGKRDPYTRIPEFQRKRKKRSYESSGYESEEGSSEDEFTDAQGTGMPFPPPPPTGTPGTEGMETDAQGQKRGATGGGGNNKSRRKVKK